MIWLAAPKRGVREGTLVNDALDAVDELDEDEGLTFPSGRTRKKFPATGEERLNCLVKPVRLKELLSKSELMTSGAFSPKSEGCA